MAGAMRKMAVYLGLVEDDGYDGPGFDPDDEFEPEPEPERVRRQHQPPPAYRPARPAERQRYSTDYSYNDFPFESNSVNTGNLLQRSRYSYMIRFS